MRYFCLITFGYELKETELSALRCCQSAGRVLARCFQSVSSFADVFADRRLANPPKPLKNTVFRMEARVGIVQQRLANAMKLCPFCRVIQHFCESMFHYVSPWFVSHFVSQPKGALLSAVVSAPRLGLEAYSPRRIHALCRERIPFSFRLSSRT